MRDLERRLPTATDGEEFPFAVESSAGGLERFCAEDPDA
jgi:hypothetical protein